MSEKEKISCPNCENRFDNDFDFCPHCGQVNKKLNLNFRYFISEFLSANFNLDSKIFLTFKLLIFFPGQLTKDFFAGKRTRYISPVRLYLLISLVYFAVLSISINSNSDSMKINPTLGDDNTIDSLLVSDKDIDDLSFSMDSEGDSTNDLGQTLRDKIKVLSSEEGKIAFKQMLQKYASVGMFILIPLTAFIFFALFYRDTYYIHHLIFSIQLQSLVFLLFTVFNLFELFIDSDVFFIIEIILVLTILTSWIKKFYNLSIGKTIWKMIIFFIAYSFLLFFFFIFVLGTSFLNL